MNRRSFLQGVALAPIAAAMPSVAVGAYPEILERFPDHGWDMSHRDYRFVMTQKQARRIIKRTLSGIPGLRRVDDFFINDDDWTPHAVDVMGEVATSFVAVEQPGSSSGS